MINSPISSWIVYTLWIALVLYLTVKAAGVKQDTHPHWVQSFILLFALIAAFLLPHLSLFNFVNFASDNPLQSSIGIILTVVGMLFLIWGRKTLGKNWSQTVAAKKDHELITSGPYAIVRNPMYTGSILAALGSAIAIGGAFVFLFFIHILQSKVQVVFIRIHCSELMTRISIHI